MCVCVRVCVCACVCVCVCVCVYVYIYLAKREKTYSNYVTDLIRCFSPRPISDVYSSKN